MTIRNLFRPTLTKGIAVLLAAGGISFTGSIVGPIAYDKISKRDTTAPCIELRTANNDLEIKVSDDFTTCPIETENPNDTTTTFNIYNKTRFSDLQSVIYSIDHGESQSIEIPKDTASANIALSPKLRYGWHEIEIEAKDELDNTRYISFKIFAYDNAVLSYSDLRKDNQNPEINTDNAILNDKNKILCNKCSISDENGVQEFKILKGNDEIASRTYTNFTSIANISQYIQGLPMKPDTKYTLVATDTKGNISNHLLDYDTFNAIVDSEDPNQGYPKRRLDERVMGGI